MRDADKRTLIIFFACIVVVVLSLSFLQLQSGQQGMNQAEASRVTSTDNISANILYFFQKDDYVEVDYDVLTDVERPEIVYTLQKNNPSRIITLGSTIFNQTGSEKFELEEEGREFCGKNTELNIMINTTSGPESIATQSFTYNCSERYEKGPYKSPNFIPYPNSSYRNGTYAGTPVSTETVSQNQTIRFRPQTTGGEHKWLVGTGEDQTIFTSNKTTLIYSFNESRPYYIEHTLTTERRTSTSSAIVQVR